MQPETKNPAPAKRAPRASNPKPVHNTYTLNQRGGVSLWNMQAANA